ncbi:DUF2637 domain-containing protein [Micromonospora sp. WMMD812]|uniref:DUF2637 domain-containing protein n=1 Tax=Micromonospora sp. WMMD812 TaxID=3015152 RepID=UPI00248C6BD0|nr:DUF2637 domain-containing protein [Micromonospora sp. WMMD812]WBB70974.1 DUF2637 domain-containing protein [Micromonospora sp. WMMD812]
MLVIGGAAGAASFRHVHDVAAAHGQPGWLAWADAVVLELTSIAAGLELRRNRRHGKSIAFPATMLTVAVFLSLAAQVVEAQASVIGWIAAALPALGFLAMVKIALGRADAAPPDRTARPGPIVSRPLPATHTAARGSREPVPGPRVPVRADPAAVRDRTAAVPASAHRRAPVRGHQSGDAPKADRRSGDASVRDRRSGDAPVRDGRPALVELVPAARTAAYMLAAHGVPLSRKALAQQLRTDGHPLSNATASALVRLLRTETTTPPPATSGPDAA